MSQTQILASIPTGLASFGLGNLRFCGRPQDEQISINLTQAVWKNKHYQKDANPIGKDQMYVRLNRTETEKEAERIGNISYKFDSTRIEHCVKSDVSNGGVQSLKPQVYINRFNNQAITGEFLPVRL